MTTLSALAIAMPARAIGAVLLLGAPARAHAETVEVPAPKASVERRVAAMGTDFALWVDAPTRGEALAASEVAVRAVEAVERRLSTWRDDSELAAFNRTEVGTPFALSSELASELSTALHWSRATDGAFDPAVGALARAWDLRGAGRVPTPLERRSAIVAGGSVRALSIAGTTARRLDATLCLEEGGLGKGAGLDAALRALAATSASRATLDLGGQIAWFERPNSLAVARGPSATSPEPGTEDPSSRANAQRSWIACDVADPRDRERRVAVLRVTARSASTSGNSERARVVDGVRHGHLLDPRSGEFARDFGSVTVLADRAIDADCLSTGLFVLGPERSLAFAAAHPSIDVLVVETLDDGSLRLRTSAGLEGRVDVLDARARLEATPPSSPARSAAQQ